MKPTINSFLKSLSPDMLKQLMDFIKSSGEQYVEMIDGTDQSKINAIKETYKYIDETMQDNLKENKPTCRKGCAHCCYLCIYVSPDEAITIREYCKLNDIEIDWDKLEAQKNLTPDNWTKNKPEISRCVFLNDTNNCSIYPVRPMVCRKYFVTSDPALCDVYSGTNDVAILNVMGVELTVVGIHNVRTYSTLPDQLLKMKP